MTTSPSPRLPNQADPRLRNISLLVLDVDGVLTDGSIIYGMRGEAYQRFNVRDGYGIAQWLKRGLHIAVISGRSSNATITRLQELGITDLHLGVTAPKDQVLRQVMDRLGVNTEHVAVMGDDVPDLCMFSLAAYSIAPADAEHAVRVAADWITPRKGGRGAVRDATEHVLAGTIK